MKYLIDYSALEQKGATTDDKLDQSQDQIQQLKSQVANLTETVKMLMEKTGYKSA